MTRRDWWLIGVSVVFGPLFGGLAFILLTGVIDQVLYGASAGANTFLLDHWPIIMSAAWAFGFVPALIFALAMNFLSRRVPRRSTRLLIAPLIGAIASPAVIALVLTPSFFGPGGDWIFFCGIAVVGAISGFLCLAYIEWRHPLPAAAP